MHTGFDIMEYDKALRRLWGKRIAASVIDFAITMAIAYSIGVILNWSIGLILFLWQGIIWFIYSSIFDALSGKTPGKYLFKIRAVSFIGPLDVWKAIGRNATKLNWIVYIADIIAGLSTEGEPRQRYSERVLDSLVIEEFKEERKVKTFKVEEEKEEFELPE
jgi:hypothetical protein